MRKLSILSLAVLLVFTFLSAAGQKPKKGGGDEYIDATLQVNDDTANLLRGDGVRPGTAYGLNTTLYDVTIPEDCVRVGVSGSGSFHVFTPAGSAIDPGCPKFVRTFTIDPSGPDIDHDFDNDGTTGAIEHIFVQIDAKTFFSSRATSTDFRFKILESVYDSNGNLIDVNGRAWVLYYPSVPVTVVSDTVRQARASLNDGTAEATLCEIVLPQGRKHPECQARDPMHLPFDFTVTLLPAQ